MVAKIIRSGFSHKPSFLRNFLTSPTMQYILLTSILLLSCIFNLDAFLPSERARTQSQTHRVKHRISQGGSKPSDFLVYTGRNKNLLTTRSKSNDGDDDGGEVKDLTHHDIVWKLRPPAGTGRRKRLWLKFAANLIRLDCILFRKTLPTALCPSGGQALLEAHTHDANGKLIKIGRFGFTTERGAPAEPIQETVSDLYGISNLVGVGAIIYMFVEPKYRKRKIGTMALEVIRCIHSIQNCDFTILVVDDDGSGKLVEWYETNGYSKAPKLQDILGSPNAINGISMITPTSLSLDEDCRIKWW